jgi:internalin A
VLQLEWLTKAIGYVLEDTCIESNAGVVHHQRLRQLWQDPKRNTHYEAHHHPYFPSLMEKFDVSYRIPDEDTSLIAQLRSSSEP